MLMTQKAKRRKNKNIAGSVVKKGVGYTMLIPGILCFLLVQTIPFFYGVLISFTDKNIFGADYKAPLHFIGLDNFKSILFDKWAASDFYQVFGFTLIYSVIVIALSYVVGMFFAILLNREMKFRNFFRALAFLPWFVNPMVMSVCWSQLMDPSATGILNSILLNLHIIKDPLLWRGAAETAKLSVIILGVWKQYPMMMVMLLSGMQGIDKTIYEPATIAGANEFQKFTHITLPLLRPMTITVMALQFIWMFGTTSYDIIMPFTAGGPVRSTYVLTVEVFNQAFMRGKIGYAAAISLMMLVFLGTLAAIFLIVKGIKKNMEYNCVNGIKTKRLRGDRN